MDSRSSACAKGCRVWVKDDRLVWRPGCVTQQASGCGDVEVELCDADGERAVVDHGCLLPRNPEMLVGSNDLTALSHLNEAAVLHSLHVRFQFSRAIYTYCGVVLVALNPYQHLPIYGNEMMSMYRGRAVGEMDPHIFAVAEEAYSTMTRAKTSQSLVITGESGAGKTVSAKYAMRYLATVGGASTETWVEKRVLMSNPVMEAFGNAKTSRNDNSSRFGKYLSLYFNSENGGCQRLSAAFMKTYLLERSRVVAHASGERSFHILYQLCAARDRLATEFGLGTASSFHYTNKGLQGQGSNERQDSLDFDTTISALGHLGFPSSHQSCLFSVLAAILHLGNVCVGERSGAGGQESYLDPQDTHLAMAAALFGVEAPLLRRWLSNRRIVVGREAFTKPLTPPQCISARDGMAKHVYAAVFDWVVKGINAAMENRGRETEWSGTIGVLDIYGFEIFGRNSFEQFCINYANEKLQLQYNTHIFKLEQNEYVKEEIEWDFVLFCDNQPCIDLIEGRLGILDQLDETCRMPGSSDALFVQKLYSFHNGKNARFSKPKTSPSEFVVSHYASKVSYESVGFVEKNVDSFIEEQLALLLNSENDFVAGLFEGRANKSKRKVAMPTVASKFRASLDDLMLTLSCSCPHYVRCIKSNDRKLPFELSRWRAVEQLRACGVLETVRISAAGFPSRWLYTDFYQRYKLLLPWKRVCSSDVKRTCHYIVQHCISDRDKYQFGKTKLFFRAGEVAHLEKLRSTTLHTSTVSIQRQVRGWLARTHYQRLRKSALAIQTYARGLLARRLASRARAWRAAVVLQKYFRRAAERRRYLSLRWAAVAMQCGWRAVLARRERWHLCRSKKAVAIQRAVKGWLARRAYQRALRRVVRVQCCVRVWASKRRLKELRAEARSVDHLKNLNKGLENKIIQLQQKLTSEVKSKGRLLDELRDELARERRMRVAAGERAAWEGKRCRCLEEQMGRLKHAHQQELEMLRKRHLEAEKEEEEETQTLAKHKKILREKATADELENISPRHPSEAVDEESAVKQVLGKSPVVKRRPLVALQDNTPRVVGSESAQEDVDALIVRKLVHTTLLLQQKDRGKLFQESPKHLNFKWEEQVEALKKANLSLKRELQQALDNASLNTELEQEVARLTRENLVLRENLELDMAECSQPAGTPKGRLQPAGTPSRPLTPKGRIGIPVVATTTTPSPSPLKYRTPRPSPSRLGMYQWEPKHLPQLVSVLVLDVRPDDLSRSGCIPCLPAHSLYMCLRYADHCSNLSMASQLADAILNAVDHLVQTHRDNMETLSFWMVNLCRLSHNLKQYNSCDNSSSANVDFTDYQHILLDKAVVIYNHIWKMIQKKTQHLIVPCLLEHEGIVGVCSKHPSSIPYSYTSHTKLSVGTLTDQLSEIVCVMEKSFVDPKVVKQLLKQTFCNINAHMLNNLLLRRDMAHWSKGMQIGYNLSRLLDWVRCRTALCGVEEQLQPVLQASKLLQMNKTDPSAILQLCTHLNVLQVQKILTMYSPADDFEERVPASVIRLVGQKGGADSADPSHLMVPIDSTHHPSFPYTPADVNFQKLSLPASMNMELNFLVKL